MRCLGFVLVAVVVIIGVIAVASRLNRPSAEVLDARCESVPSEIVRNLETGLTVDGGGSLRAAQAVRSRDHPKAWFVAADIQGTGIDGDGPIGVWATDSLDPSNPRGFIGAEPIAREFSDWGTGGDNPFGLHDDGIDLSRKCVSSSLARA